MGVLARGEGAPLLLDVALGRALDASRVRAVRRRAQRAADAGAAGPAVADAAAAVVVMMVAASATAADTGAADEVGDVCWQRRDLLHDGEGGSAARRVGRPRPPGTRRDDRTREKTVVVEVAAGGGREGARNAGRGLLVRGEALILSEGGRAPVVGVAFGEPVVDGVDHDGLAVDSQDRVRRDVDPFLWS